MDLGLSEGTIYPIILRLQKNEMIKATLRESHSGPPRKYYHLTENGITELNQFKENWQELEYAVNRLFMRWRKLKKATKELLKRNNLREKDIVKESQEVYTNMIVYIRGSNISEYNQEIVREDIIK